MRMRTSLLNIPGGPDVPLIYSRLKAALDERAANKRVKRPELLLQGREIGARYLHDGIIALRLHQTDIAEYRPDGSILLRGKGWLCSNQTVDWLNEATNYRMQYLATDRWNGKTHHINGSAFYDGIIIKGNELLSERKPVMRNVPNAEAKALRKNMTKLLKFYRPYIKLAEGNAIRGKWSGEYANLINATARVVAGIHEFDPHVMAYLLRALWTTDVSAYAVAQRQVTKVYESHVMQHNMFDQVEVTV